MTSHWLLTTKLQDKLKASKEALDSLSGVFAFRPATHH